MATIVEGAWWTLTNAAAEVLVGKGLIVECKEEHVDAGDGPIYHLSSLSKEVGFTNIDSYISEAESEVNE